MVSPSWTLSPSDATVPRTSEIPQALGWLRWGVGKRTHWREVEGCLRPLACQGKGRPPAWISDHLSSTFCFLPWSMGKPVQGSGRGSSLNPTWVTAGPAKLREECPPSPPNLLAPAHPCESLGDTGFLSPCPSPRRDFSQLAHTVFT